MVIILFHIQVAKVQIKLEIKKNFARKIVLQQKKSQFGTFLLQYDFSGKVLLYFQFYLYLCTLDMKQNNHRTEEDYYIESKTLRAEVMQIADTLKNCPMRFTVTNGIRMDVEVTKSDLKTIASKNTQDNRFNAFKNKLAQDIKGFIEKAKYEGWREVIPGKHPETAYFAYFSRELGEKAYLCIRKISNTGLFKPYAIIDQKTFDAEIQNLRK